MVHKPNILIIDDDTGLVRSIQTCLGEKYNFFSAIDSKGALSIIREEALDVILLDIMLGEENGLDLIPDLKKKSPLSEIIMLTASDSANDAVTAMKQGAFDYLTKPFETNELELTIQKAIDKIRIDTKVALLEEDLGRLKKFEDLVYASPAMQKLVEDIKHVATLDSTVLIKGESGTGKELVARAIHSCSPRKDKPFVSINCASIPDNLFEAEMFGFERGAFTGAIQAKRGKFEMAQGGSIFLDEASSLRVAGQASLLRAIDLKEIERVGSNKKLNLDIRIIAATNRNHEEMVIEKTFREDLFYRLNVIPLDIPPLRERKEDIIVLAKHFIKKYNYILNKECEELTPDATEALIEYHWPGNVRELENLVERLLALNSNSRYIGLDALPLEIVIPEKSLLDSEETLNLEVSRQRFERELILAALERADWNRKLTAKILGIHVNTLLKKINDLKIVPPPKNQSTRR